MRQNPRKYELQIASAKVLFPLFGSYFYLVYLEIEIFMLLTKI